jgi:hypothetical protein
MMPMPSVVEVLSGELAALETEMQNDPRYRKIARIRALLSEYSAVNNSSSQPQSKVVTYAGRARLPTLGTKKAEIHATVRDVLIRRGPTHRSELLQAVEAAGVNVSNTNPMVAFAAYLSDFKDLQSLGGGRWALRETKANEAPISEPMEAP